MPCTCRTSSANQLRRAAREVRDRWGCRLYVSAKRCPACGTKNFKRTKDDVCLHCTMKGED
jgi:hypothetical protein